MRRIAICCGLGLFLLFAYVIADSTVRPGTHCPHCNARMLLLDSHVGGGDLEWRLYKCTSCGAQETEHWWADGRKFE